MEQSELLDTNVKGNVVEDGPDFSLVTGGPLYQLYLRSRLAGMLGNRIWQAGATLLDFKMGIVGAMLFLMLLVLAPLCFFMAPLNLARRTTNREFGVLASHYADDFRRKWIQRPQEKRESCSAHPTFNPWRIWGTPITW